MASMQSAMNYLRRRFSDTNFNSNLSNGYMVDTQSDEGFERKESTPHSTNSGAMNPGHSGGFFASLASGNPLAVLKHEAQDRFKTVLVVDDQHTDWSKYFKNKKIHGDFQVRVEQAEFKEISLSSHSQSGVTVDISCFRNGNKIVRSFKPDFLLVRQPGRSMVAGEDFKNLVIGLKYGGVPSINSLHSQYNFMDKAWAFSQLIRIQKRLGWEKFPLIEQTFYPSHAHMVTWSHFPIVLKIGHSHRGTAKFKVNNHYEFQDVVGVAALTNAYVVVEAYVDAEYDIRVQKIGGNYKTYKRTSVSKNWKANIGSAVLEEAAVTERQKLWVDACSEIFGGLDMVAVKAVHGSDGKDYIVGVSDCSMPLIGEKQEEDRKMIAELVTRRMTACIRPRSISDTQSHTRNSQSYFPINNPNSSETTMANNENVKPHFKAAPMSAPPSCVPSAPASVNGSEPSSPVLSRQEHSLSDASYSRKSRSVDAARADEENKAEKIRSLRQSFANLFTDN